MSHWGFPDEIIRCQQIPSAQDALPLQQITEVAVALTGCVLKPTSRGITETLGGLHPSCPLQPEIVQESLMEAMERVEEIAQQMKVEMNKERDLLELMEKANQTLIRLSEKMEMLCVQRDTTPLPSLDSLHGEGDVGELINRTLQAVAHEIRNPLMVVGGFAKRLSKALDPSTPSGRYAQIILKEAMRLEATLSSMDLSE
jgi:nitrogen-specific signal transduction histidine kinase